MEKSSWFESRICKLKVSESSHNTGFRFFEGRGEVSQSSSFFGTLANLQFLSKFFNHFPFLGYRLESSS